MIIRLRNQLLPPLLALALVACAEKQVPAPSGPNPKPESSQKAKKEGAKPKYTKPVRMNGRGEISSISLEDFFLLQQSGKALIFDARPGFFHGLGHIPGSINIPAKNCDEKIAARESEIKAAIASGKTIVVYCTNLVCPDARTLAIHISGFGYPARIFSGGWDAWKDAGMPLE